MYKHTPFTITKYFSAKIFNILVTLNVLEVKNRRNVKVHDVLVEQMNVSSCFKWWLNPHFILMDVSRC